MDLLAVNFIDSLEADPLQLLIPFIAGVVGWFTNVVAVQMMFKPVEFVGIRPPFGWQGIIPGNALRLARVGVKLVTEQLLNVRDLFVDFDPKPLIDGNREELDRVTDRIISEKAAEHFPGMWNALAPEVKQQVITMAQNEVATLSGEVLKEASIQIGEILDVGAIVEAQIIADKPLMGNIFRKVGVAEFKFIERSGLYFGFVFGLIQLLVWVYFPAWWVLPFFGFLVGYATNWLALKLIFDPKEPIKAGPWKIQGLFHRRQAAISKEFGDIMAARVFTTDNVFDEMSQGRSREKLLEIVKEKSDELLEKYKKNPMAAPIVMSGKLDEIEGSIMAEVENEMFRHGGLIYYFGDKADMIQEMLSSRMSSMDAEAYENVLRPAFKQDEWKLILAGAVLGLGAGIAQVGLMFAEHLG